MLYHISLLLIYFIHSSLYLLIPCPYLAPLPSLSPLITANLTTSLKILSPNTHSAYWGLGLQHMNFGKDTIQPIAPPYFKDKQKSSFSKSIEILCAKASQSP